MSVDGAGDVMVDIHGTVSAYFFIWSLFFVLSVCVCVCVCVWLYGLWLYCIGQRVEWGSVWVLHVGESMIIIVMVNDLLDWRADIHSILCVIYNLGFVNNLLRRKQHVFQYNVFIKNSDKYYFAYLIHCATVLIRESQIHTGFILNLDIFISFYHYLLSLTY